ncbi:MAG: hypothetical protein KAI17_17600, partial [Thiotrichaceae bacterium]|nr:hypothetical protein [Thiotrichaceae bacterium]
MKKILILTITLFQMLVSQTNIARLEYFIDTGPAVQVNITAANTIDVNFSVDLTGVNDGFHYVGFRAQSNTGVWSYTTVKRFWKIQKGNNIAAMEYYIDTDPGIGAANAVAITYAESIDENIIIPLSGINPGFHYLGIRVQDDDGAWSLTELVSFFAAKKGDNISGLEYFIDSDPGVGNASSLALSSPDFDIDETVIIPLTGISNGFHYLGIRSRDDAGVWSMTMMHSFMSVKTAANVTALEYFIDSDPGLGSGTPVTVASPGDSIIVNFDVSLSGLAEGMHFVGFRTRDDKGNWSLTNTKIFLKESVPAVNITSCEYFIDSDPGLGSGTAVAITAAASIDTSVVIELGNLALNDGLHTIGIRTKDSNGQWSLSSMRTFLKVAVPASQNIIACEY